MNTDHFPWQQAPIIRHSLRLLHSFHHWTGKPLLAVEGEPAAIAEALFNAPFVVVSHGTEADPVLNYGNQMALKLWEMDWLQFTQTPSRYTAEPIEREERARLLQRAREKGFIDDYEGVRISSNGRRFQISQVVLWDVLDETGQHCGQAATFDRWTFL
ncbi:MEKHLA domain-containing protein [Leptodesmis sp.]|uniref:MEKHLA domain-containing protein n=1 Tax=Leptodesmis sp. TaxID=3100501 RepID=UPI004053528E